MREGFDAMDQAIAADIAKSEEAEREFKAQHVIIGDQAILIEKWYAVKGKQ